MMRIDIESLFGLLLICLAVLFACVIGMIIEFIKNGWHF